MYIFIESRYSGLRAFYGKGAGGKETASVMYEDLLDLYERCYWFETANRVECRNVDINERNAGRII